MSEISPQIYGIYSILLIVRVQQINSCLQLPIGPRFWRCIELNPSVFLSRQGIHLPFLFFAGGACEAPPYKPHYHPQLRIRERAAWVWQHITLALEVAAPRLAPFVAVVVFALVFGWGAGAPRIPIYSTQYAGIQTAFIWGLADITCLPLGRLLGRWLRFALAIRTRRWGSALLISTRRVLRHVRSQRKIAQLDEI